MSSEITYQTEGQKAVSLLKSRLLDLSKRNRNLYYKARKSSVVLDFESKLMEDFLAKGKVLVTKPKEQEKEEKFVALDKLRLASNRNKKEYGVNSLKLAVCFITWEDKKGEKVNSPLLFLPAQIKKRKGFKDSLLIDLLSSELEVNPFLNKYWKKEFSFDLNEVSVSRGRDMFVAQLVSLINKRNETEQANFKFKINIKDYVLDNFDFRQMSIVEDYESIERNKLYNSIEPFFDGGYVKEEVEIKHKLFNPLPADKSQFNAIQEGVSGQNLIIQGPPGTGKSQTITNLLANYLILDKKVLFVCEKRTALEVVKNKMKSINLDGFCLLLSDPKREKKEIVADLKEQYLKIGEAAEFDHIAYRVNKLNDEVKNRLSQLISYGNTLKSGGKESLYNLLFQAIELRAKLEDKSAPSDEYDSNISYADWLKCETETKALYDLLSELGSGNNYSDYAFNLVNTQCLINNIHADELHKELNKLTQISPFEAFVQKWSLPDVLSSNLGALSKFFIKVKVFEKLAEYKLLHLLDKTDKRSKKYISLNKKWKTHKLKFERQKEAIVNWNNKLPLQEAKLALEVVENSNNGWFSFLNFKLNRVKKAVKRSYNFSAHQIAPWYDTVLKDLIKYYELEEKHNNLVNQYQELGVEYIDVVQFMFEEAEKSSLDEDFANFIVKTDKNYELVTDSVRISAQFDVYNRIAKRILNNASELNFKQVQENAEKVLSESVKNEEILPITKKIINKSLLVYNSIQNHKGSFNNIKYKYSVNEVNKILILNYNFKEFSAINFNGIIDETAHLLKEKDENNAAWISINKLKYLDNRIKLCSKPAANLSEEEKIEKKKIKEARKVLENEFSKTRRYLTIRELEAKGAKTLVQDLKPIWMMTPYAVAESFDVIKDFDVIVCDEASQIKLEVGLPCLMRGKQIVIVGDDKQMQPSNYFQKTEQHLELGESVLNEFNTKFKNVNLNWHYRSEHPKLIQFSNKWFYNNELNVFPGDPKLNPIVFNYIENGVFENRKNKEEANALVNSVFELLKQGKTSIGIVAFSLDQKMAIDKAFDKLCKSDQKFAQLFEQASTLELENLFVKNLENVQGDEREVIIISVGYAKNAEGKFLQNFGPINQSGGENRLNVLFSRAKEQVQVFSSIKHDLITNINNDGANILKEYLRYAEYGSINAEKELNTENDKEVQLMDYILGEGYEIGSYYLGSDKIIEISKGEKSTLVCIDNLDVYSENGIENRIFIESILNHKNLKVEFVLLSDLYFDIKPFKARIKRLVG